MLNEKFFLTGNLNFKSAIKIYLYAIARFLSVLISFPCLCKPQTDHKNRIRFMNNNIDIGTYRKIHDSYLSVKKILISMKRR